MLTDSKFHDDGFRILSVYLTVYGGVAKSVCMYVRLSVAYMEIVKITV